MFITGFKIKDCLYITNKEINSIDSTMRESFQLILGTNGAGKSVLCRLLTAWPPKPKSFRPGGFFELTARSGTDDYLIRYDFAKTVKCTFIKNDIVLNDKSTTTVQKEMLKEHLGIDQDIYKLVNGDVLFTKMSATERKRWIDKVSPIDMTYVTGVYDRVRKSARDIKGAIKVNTERMHREQTRLDALGLPESIEQEYEALNDKFIVLTKEHDANNPSAENVTKQISQLDEEIKSNLAYLVKLGKDSRRITKQANVKNFGELDERLTYLRVHDNSLIAKAESIMVDVAELDKVMHTFKGPLGRNTEELNESLNDFREGIRRIKETYANGLPFMLTYDDYPLAQSMVEFETVVRKLAVDMPSNSKPDWYSRSEANKVLERRTELTGVVRNLDIRLERMNDKLREMKDTKLIDCPDCKHSFHLGFTEEDVRRLEGNIDKAGQVREGYQKELTLLIEKCKEVDTYREAASYYVTAKSVSSRHAGFWSTVEEKGYLGTNPNMLNVDLVRYIETIGDLRSIHITQIEIERIESTLRNMAGLGDQDVGSIRARRDGLLRERREALELVEANKEETTTLDSFRRLAFEQKSLMEGIESKMIEIDSCYSAITAAMHHDIIREEIDKVVGRLATIRESVNKKKVLSNVIDGIKEQLEEIKQQQEDWHALSLLLSPEKGIIASQVNSYIGGFITIMNQTINSIWSYPVEVQPCKVETGGLDYLFPVDMPTRASSPDDVSECSKGQQEVINFAFVLAVFQCLDLSHLPLFLDELGSSFDEEHASRLMVYLNRLIDSGTTNQMFMVNHFQAMHGALKNAEVLVLDEDNVTAPVTANEHVKFNSL